MIYINDLTDELISNPFIYADDTMVFEVVENADSKWLVTMNPSKCHSLVFSLRVKPLHPTLYLNSTCVEEVDKHTELKKGIKSIFCSLIGKKRFNVHLNRWASILHARLRLGSHSLNEYSFKINCCSSPICHCGIENETVEHYFLNRPRFAAQRVSLFASAERMCGRYWSESNDQMKLFYILNGFDNLSYSSNSDFFHEVHRHIISSCRFSPVFL